MDANGWVTSETNARGFTTSYAYNAAGWMTGIDRPSPWADTTVTYENLGTVDFQSREQRGTVDTVTWYDSLLRPQLVRTGPTSGDGVTNYVKTNYDVLGRTIFTSQPSSSSNPTQGTETTYDGLGRVVQTRENFAPFVTTTTEYLMGNRMRVTDPLGHQTTTTQSGYGSFSDGQTTLVQQPEGVMTALSYDIFGNILSATQSGTANDVFKTSTQQWSYDDRLRVCRHAVPETGSTLFQYDEAYQVIAYSEGNSGSSGCASIPTDSRVLHSYDPRGRLNAITYSDATPDVSLDYDPNGNVIRNARGEVIWTYAYDSGDRLVDESLSIDDRTYGLNYQYNPIGSLIRRTLPSGRVVNYDTNGLGQVTGVESDDVDYANGINYHVNGAISGMTYGNGQVYSQTLNDRQLPTRLRTLLNGSAAMDLEYNYDPRGDVTQILDRVDPSLNRTMTYDDLGRLDTANGVWGNGAYTYDVLGNLLQKQMDIRSVEVSYDANNRAVQSTDNAGSTRQISYDSRGNVTQLGALTFVYDQANQPVSLSGESNGTYTYDGNFKRVKVQVDNQLIYNVYDASGRLIHIDNVTGGFNINVCLTTCSDIGIPESTDYLRAGPMTIARLENGQPTYLHPDLLGSPVAATDAQGDIAWQEHYTPFGEKWELAEANEDQMGFTGHIVDSATGLTYMQARYYDPVIGRFLANDPVDFLGHLERGNSAAFGMNRYAYANNNPYKYTDPDGKFCVPCAAAAVGAVLNTAVYVATTDFSEMSGGDIGLGLAKAAITGAVVGAATSVGATQIGAIGTAAGLSTGTTVGLTAIGAGAVGTAAEGVNQMISGEMNAGKMAAAGIGNAVGAVLGGGVSKPISNTISAAISTPARVGTGVPILSTRGVSFPPAGSAPGVLREAPESVTTNLSLSAGGVTGASVAHQIGEAVTESED